MLSQKCPHLVTLDTESDSAFIEKMQQVFLRKRSARDDYEQSPIHQVIDLAKASKCEMRVYIEKLENLHQEPIQEYMYYICQKVLQSYSSHRQIYLTTNPHLSQHPLYLTNNIPKYIWKALTQVKLGSHWLKIETG